MDGTLSQITVTGVLTIQWSFHSYYILWYLKFFIGPFSIFKLFWSGIFSWLVGDVAQADHPVLPLDCGGTSISNVIFCSHSKMLAMPDCKCLILTKSFSVLRCTASCTCLWNILQTDKLTVVAKHVLTLFKMFVNMPKKSCWGSSFSGNNELLLEK